MSLTTFPPCENCMEVVIDRLKRSLTARKEGIQENLFPEGMTYFFGAQVQNFVPELHSYEWCKWEEEVAFLVTANDGAWFAYVYDTVNSAIRAEVEGWAIPCIRRSAIQFLVDRCEGVVDEDDMVYVQETDDWLRDRARRVAPLEGVVIPSGVPDSHWWWRLPSGDGMPSFDDLFGDPWS